MAKSNRKRRGRGEGGIYQRTDGLWVASVTLGKTAKGKQRRVVVYGRTKAQAHQKLQELIARGKPQKPTDMTLGAYLEQWHDLLRGKVGESTHHRYVYSVRKLVRYAGTWRLVDLTALDVERLYAQLAAAGESDHEQQRCGKTLRKALAYAVRPLGLIPHSPAREVPLPRVARRRMRVWDRAQVRTFWEHASKDRLYALYVLAVTGGFREGELFALDWPDVDFSAGAVVVQRTLIDRGHKLKAPKTAASMGTVLLPPEAIAVLRDHRERMSGEGWDVVAGPVFCGRRKGLRLWRANVFTHSWQRILERSGLPRIRFHDLRHTCATFLLTEGVHPRVVQEMLRHADVGTTMRTYSHVMPVHHQEAARKMSGLFEVPGKPQSEGQTPATPEKSAE